MSTTQVAFRYAGRSGLRVERGEVRLGLATTERRTFVDGRAERADVLGTGLLVVARVAASRYDTSDGVSPELADPFVTTGEGVVRFESLSGCCAVGARLDLLPSGLDLTDHAPGTTNVELGQRVRELLGGPLPRDPMRLVVHAAGLGTPTPESRVHERRVVLPARWVRSLAELPSIASVMTVRAELSARQARSFVRSLPQGSAAPVWVRPARDGLRVVPSAGPGAVPLGVPGALRELEPLLRHAHGLRLWAHDATGVSWWELELPHARLGLALGMDVASRQGHDVARDLRVGRAADAAAGLLGYDLSAARWFDRRLPVGRDLLDLPEPDRAAHA
ncbi:MAG: hypothetical protein NVV70_13215 [Cellulomonas sp.]|uniref:hypothetical protein n=1 Tax=unclassified Cellulomonas TaxID=2620175 RepID=UPI00069D7BC1|nr:MULTISPECIES: hypothetical protein [unclassified Cellulomonas]MCR6649041.1 hypothetical protein [Cellulomonas sp.]MCR6705034.1 hypothetical protein [Cellulomonas sp.]